MWHIEDQHMIVIALLFVIVVAAMLATLLAESR
jgi:hypothetical protein